MRRRFWTADEDATLRALYSDTPTYRVAQQIGRPIGSVYQRAIGMGLRKSEAYLSSPYAGRLRPGHNQGGATRFKAWQRSWNKGTHYTAGGRSVETRFKTGRPAHEASNYRPIGSLRVSKDGYLERKVTDDPKLVPARRWVAVHRLVWEAAHGPIPQAHAVVFKSGQFTQDVDAITVDKLEMISRIELMRRNTVHNYPKPVARAIQLLGALNRQIRKRSRNEEQDRRPA